MSYFSSTRTVRTITSDGHGAPRTETKTYTYGDDGPSVGYGGGNVDIGFGKNFGGGKYSINVGNFIGGRGGGDDGSSGRRRCIRQPSQRPQVGGRSTRKEKKNPFAGLNNQSYDEIKKRCLEEGILFEDPEFPAEDESIFFSRSPPRPFEWKRPGVSSLFVYLIDDTILSFVLDLDPNLVEVRLPKKFSTFHRLGWGCRAENFLGSQPQRDYQLRP